ncbi:MAG: malonate transporter subunit MadL [Cyclobacteriaceae bacterium]
MRIYGVAFLAACYLLGQLMGKYLGMALGIGGNVGGVGLGMLLLIFANHYYYKQTAMPVETKGGIVFWSSMYIPVVIAMASSLNVKAAVSGGWVAVVAGIVATACCYLLIPVLSKWSSNQSANPEF